MEYSSYQ